MKGHLILYEIPLPARDCCTSDDEKATGDMRIGHDDEELVSHPDGKYRAVVLISEQSGSKIWQPPRSQRPSVAL